MSETITIPVELFNKMVDTLDDVMKRVGKIETTMGHSERMEEHLTISDVCRILKISRTQLQRLEKEGLPRHYVGKRPRYYMAEIMKFNYSRKHHERKEKKISTRPGLRQNRGNNKVVVLTV